MNIDDGGLDLSWSMSGMSISGSLPNSTSPGKSKRRQNGVVTGVVENDLPLDEDDTDGLDGSALGLEVVGRHMVIPKLSIANSFHAEPAAAAAAAAGGAPAPGAQAARKHKGALPSPGGSAVAAQLQQISESYKIGLISPEERGILKDNMIKQAYKVQAWMHLLYCIKFSMVASACTLLSYS